MRQVVDLLITVSWLGENDPQKWKRLTKGNMGIPKMIHIKNPSPLVFAYMSPSSVALVALFFFIARVT